MESDSVILGLLGRIHVLMRRVTNRITDVEYMYQQGIRPGDRAARGETGHAELIELCDRPRAAMELDPLPESDTPARASLLERLRAGRPAATHPVDRYVGTLR